MYYDPDNNNDDNRVQAGCNVPNSVCNAMPFSQIFNDPLSLSQPSCDEWPMAVSTLPVNVSSSSDTDRETLSGNEAATLQRPTTQLPPMY